MEKQRASLVTVIMSIISTVLTFFAPLAKETTEGLISTYSDTVSLFSGVDSELCVALTVIAGICFVLFTCIGLFGGIEGKGIVGARISGISLLALQFICLVQSMNYYDDSSLLGALRSEMSAMSVHPLAIVTMIVTMVTVILCFKAKPAKIEQGDSSSVD